LITHISKPTARWSTLYLSGGIDLLARLEPKNPTKASDVVGFESIRMDHDVTSRYDVGEALMYTESNFESFAWGDMPSPSSYKLKIAPEVSR